MTELSLLEKLRLAHVTTGQRMLGEAAERIEALERDAVLISDAMVALTDRVAELKAALKPFADASDLHLGSDDMSIAFGIKIGDLRQARKALEALQGRPIGEKP